MRWIIYYSFFIVLCLGVSSVKSQVFYEDKFTIPERGAWGDDQEDLIHSNFSDINWTLDVRSCAFESTADYVKTVSTSGGRLEALDCNGEAIFYSPWITTGEYQNIQLEILVGETGSGNNTDNKYIQCSYRTSPDTEFSFNNNSIAIGNFGSQVFLQKIDLADSLQIVIRLNNHYAGDKIYVSSIRMSGEPVIVGKDRDAQVIPHGNQITASEIPSTAEATPIMKFQIFDGGTRDSLPTIVKRMRILAEAQFHDEIIVAPVDGFRFYIDDQLVEIDSIVKEEDFISVWPKPGVIKIDNGKIANISCEVILQKENLIDGSLLHFLISSENHGWQADTSSTQFSGSFEESTESEEFKLSVPAEEFRVERFPEIVGVGTPFSIEGEMVDRNENIDLDFSGDEMISVRLGEMTVKGISLIKDENGLFRWDGFVAKKPGISELEIQFPGSSVPPTILSIEVVPEIKELINEDFESDKLAGWHNNEEWNADTTGAISGLRSLRHKDELKGGNSYIQYPYDQFDGDKYLANWEFSLKNGKWNPSSSNRFFFFICDKTYDPDQFTGYSLGVNQKGSKDSLQFCFWEKGLVKDHIKSLPFVWEENTDAKIKVFRKPGGYWELSIKNNGHNYFDNPISVMDNQLAAFSVCGLSFDYSSTRSGKLWMDDVSLRIIPAPISVKKVEAIAANELRISFTKPYEINSALDLINYRVENEDGDQILLRGIEQEKETTILLETGEVEETELSLFVERISDLQGRLMKEQMIDFKFNPPVLPGMLIINEVLFNPKPGGSDYIELYNPQSLPVNIGQLSVATRNDTFAIDQAKAIGITRFIHKGEYVVLTTDSANIKSYYPNSGMNCYAEIKKMPSYPDKEGYVVLLNDSMKVVDEMAYSEKHHFSLLNDKEGVALERVSCDKYSMDPSNWHSAAETAGYGTPGLKNSQDRQQSTQEEQFYFEPNPFSPNNDGMNDRLDIILNFKSGEVATVRIFDSRGRTIRTIANNMLIGNSTTLTWDGLDEQGHKVLMGTYVILAELHDSNGNRKIFKKSVGVTDRLD